MAEQQITEISDRALSISASSTAEARALGDQLRANGAWQDVVPGLKSVSVLFDPVTLPIEEARRVLVQALSEPPPQGAQISAEPITIPVQYGHSNGPDLDHVAQLLGLSSARVIELHTAPLYEVDMMGFLPGFLYLGGLDPRLTVARRADPRLRIPGGSVAIGGDRAGVYSLRGSGGWQVIGRTDHPLFDPQAKDPFALKPGMTLRFEAAS